VARNCMVCVKTVWVFVYSPCHKQLLNDVFRWVSELRFSTSDWSEFRKGHLALCEKGCMFVYLNKIDIDYTFQSIVGICLFSRV